MEGPQKSKIDLPCDPAYSPGYSSKRTGSGRPRYQRPTPTATTCGSKLVVHRQASDEQNPASDATEGGSALNEEGNPTTRDDLGEPWTCDAKRSKPVTGDKCRMVPLTRDIHNRWLLEPAGTVVARGWAGGGEGKSRQLVSPRGLLGNAAHSQLSCAVRLKVR